MQLSSEFVQRHIAYFLELPPLVTINEFEIFEIALKKILEQNNSKIPNKKIVRYIKSIQRMHCGNSKKLLNSLLPTLESTLSSIIDTSMEQKINYIQERNMETRVALEQCEIELKKNFPNHCTELLKKINFEELLPYEIITISSALKKLRPLIPIEKFLEMDRVMFRDLLVNYDRVIMLSEAISSNLFAHLLVADQVKSRLVVRNIPAFLFLLRHDIDFSELMNLDRDTLKAVLHHSQEFVNLIKNGIDFNLITKLESDLLTETLENDNLPIDSRLIGILGRFPTKIRTLLASEVKFSTFLTAWKCLLDHGFPFMLVDLFQTHIMKDLINHYDKIDLKLVLRFLKKYDSIPVIEGLFQEGFKFSYFLNKELFELILQSDQIDEKKLLFIIKHGG